MKSHTVPQKLLEQFAYDDPLTKSKRLWRYQKGRPPYWKASPKTATSRESHFSDPADPTKEPELEARLNQEFEQPVNNFLFQIGDPSFLPTVDHRKLLTFYVTLLFHRSEARRIASTHLQRVFDHALELFLGNESQLLTVAANWNIDLLLGGKMQQGLITKDDVKAKAQALHAELAPEVRAQRSYLRTVEGAMQHLDEQLFNGEWNYLRTVPSDPFIISDAPVATWKRMPDGRFEYGLGFHRPDVEVLLPISPHVCLHIQPKVQRTKASVRPSVVEVNAVQAAFAGRFCFCNIRSEKIDRIVQQNFGKAELGVKSFTIWHRNYANAFFDILMNDKQILKSR